MWFLAELEVLTAQGLDRLCADEVASRGLPSDVADRLRSALSDESLSEAERVAAKLAVGAALRRRAASPQWAGLRTGGDEAVALGLARAYAVAHALTNQWEVPTPAARRNVHLALIALARRVRRDDGLQRQIRSVCPELEGVPWPPRTVVAALWAAAGQQVRRLWAIVTRRGNVADVPVVDPDPWWQPADRAERAGAAKAGATGSSGDGRAAFLASLLGVYSAQYASYTSLLWQVPALSLTAQAFLLTLALSHGNGYFAKVTASLLSMLIAIASSRLMHDQRGHAINHGELALRVSRELQLTRQLGDLRVNDAKPARTDAETIWVSWDRHIYGVWRATLTLFGVADAVVLVQVIVSAIRHG